MSLMPMVLLSVLAGLVAAGFSWYIWGMVENVLHAFRNRAPQEGDMEG